ncbi:MAG: YhgE/Pip domain-containing protein, partial [Clostridia bacterium]|nr:YhgE/Pip domain-containing protein [Clostridia bacterium]
NGAILLNDGAAELHGGTADLKSAVDGLDDKVANRIKEAIDEKIGKNVPNVSFVDERNNTGAVQFVITTRAIREEEPEAEEEPEQADEETFRDRLVHLFAW